MFQLSLPDILELLPKPLLCLVLDYAELSAPEILGLPRSTSQVVVSSLEVVPSDILKSNRVDLARLIYQRQVPITVPPDYPKWIAKPLLCYLIHQKALVPSAAMLTELCECGSKSALRTLIEDYKLVPTQFDLRIACYRGRPQSIRYLVASEAGPRFGGKELFVLVHRGLIDIVQYWNHLTPEPLTREEQRTLVRRFHTPDLLLSDITVAKLYASVASTRFMVKCRLQPQMNHLEDACYRGRFKVVRYMTGDLKLVPNSRCLELACLTKCLKLVQYLVKECNVTPSRKCLQYAVCSGYVRIVRYLVEKCRVELTDNLEINDLATARYLHSRGYSPTSDDLNRACRRDSQIDLVQFLVLDCNITPNSFHYLEARYSPVISAFLEARVQSLVTLDS